ncbi:hypothetical protein BLNAU_13935 [Blattamonas nauphoetae]|uniref:Uncharacterized protein n=1 Tax=Blattamonas nauphoetae TaxID=2049346 RepID=A0ABQ9XI98_9EUKA|nr:hypothetical protein BLNAU_13935 [Blattamonas nauphoetae]
MNHLVSAGHVVPICTQSETDEIMNLVTDLIKESFPLRSDFYSMLLLIMEGAYCAIRSLEKSGAVSQTVRLTHGNPKLRSQHFKNFVKLLEPELEVIRSQFSSDLFEEARRISSWKEFLQTFAGGEEVEIDTSFLKLPFFRTTLLSLHAKFPKLVSSVDGSAGISTSSLLSSHPSPHTSLETRFDSSLRTLSSSAPFKSESLHLLSSFSSLLSSQLTSITPSRTIPPELFASGTVIQSQTRNTDPTETFDKSIFDEEDNEKLAQSLIRCRSVCDVVGADKCIRNISAFVHQTVSAIGSSHTLLRAAAFALFRCLVQTPKDFFEMKETKWYCRSLVIRLWPSLWTRLSSQIERQPEEQLAFVRLASTWLVESRADRSLSPFPFAEFDWEILYSADLSWKTHFYEALDLVMSIRSCSSEEQIGIAAARQIIFNFEHRHNAFSRITSDSRHLVRGKFRKVTAESLISYSLLMTLVRRCEFPDNITSFITEHPEIDAHTLLLDFENELLYLCHTSLNPHKPHQPPLDLLFERTLRTNPLRFFLHSKVTYSIISSSVRNTSLCGFHALCRRGIHISLIESEVIKNRQHFLSSYGMFLTPLFTRTFNLFLHFTPPLVVRFFLPILLPQSNCEGIVDGMKVVLSALIHITAPFGDCLSLKELYHSIKPQHNVISDWSPDSDVTSGFQALEWLSIPTGFGSALIHSNPHVYFGPFEDQVRTRASTDDSDLSNLSKLMARLLSPQVRNICCKISSLVEMLPLLPLITTVSVNLEFVKRLACFGNETILMAMVCYGILDVVIRAVSESTFLEDYENGICVIGMLLPVRGPPMVFEILPRKIRKEKD